MAVNLPLIFLVPIGVPKYIIKPVYICYYSSYIKETEQINCCLQNLGKSQNSI